jgi:hypothetical protein
MRTRRCGLRLAACALLAVTGCGGGGAEPKPPTAAEIVAAHGRWRDRVDDVCFDVNRAIGRRGRPDEVAAIGPTVAAGVEDVRAGIRRITAVPLAEGGTRAPAEFVRELKALDAEVAELPEGGADMEPAELVAAADRLGPLLRRLELRAGQAGLTNCMTHSEQETVPDGVRSPVFLEQLTLHERRFAHQLPVYERPSTSPAQLADRMDALGRLLDGAVADAAAFDPTNEAAKPTEVYVASMRGLLSETRRFEAFVLRGGATSSPAGLRRRQRTFGRAWREASRAFGRLTSRAGLPPVSAGGDAGIDAERN